MPPGPVAVLAVLVAVTTAVADPCSVVIRHGSINAQYEVDYSQELGTMSRAGTTGNVAGELSRNDSRCSASSTSSASTSSSLASSSSSFRSPPRSRIVSGVRTKANGPHAKVFRAKHRKTGRDVVVKRFPNQSRPEALKEAETMAFLDSVPTTMKLYDVVLDDQYTHLVMQYFHGQTVRDYLTVLGGSMEADDDDSIESIIERIRYIAGSVARTVIQFRDLGIVYRDLCTLNVMIDEEDNVVVIDMGGSFTQFDHWSAAPPKNDDKVKAATAVLERFFKTFVQQMVLCTVQAHLFDSTDATQTALYKRIVQALDCAPRPMLNEFFQDCRARPVLVGDNARRRYRDFRQRAPLSTLMDTEAVRPVVSDERLRAQARRWTRVGPEAVRPVVNDERLEAPAPRWKRQLEPLPVMGEIEQSPALRISCIKSRCWIRTKVCRSDHLRHSVWC